MKNILTNLSTQINTYNLRGFLNNKIRRKAFTLVEILLAVFILEIGLLGVAGFYAKSLNISKTARNETTASNLASGLLDEQLENNYSNLSVGEGTKTRYSSDSNDPFYNWHQKTDIAYIDSNLSASYSEPDTNMKKVTITIYWMENTSERTFQIASIKARH